MAVSFHHRHGRSEQRQQQQQQQLERRRRQIRYQHIWRPGAYEAQAAPKLPRRGRPPPLYDYRNAGEEGEAKGRWTRRATDGLVRSWLDQFPSSSSSSAGAGGAKLDRGHVRDTLHDDEESARVPEEGERDDDELWDAVLEGLVGRTAEMRLDGSGRWRVVRRGPLGAR